jgi:hypothetical protein
LPPELKKGELNKDWGMKIDTPFYVISNLPDGRYLDILGNNMVIKRRNGFDSQKWFFDQKTRSIKSVRTPSKSWDIQNSGKAVNMQIYNTNSGWFQLFKWDGKDSFYNVENNKALEVKGGVDEEATNVQVWKRNPKSKAQSWRLVYTSDAKKVATKGLNKEFGLHINRPFFLVSKMYMERVVECVGAANLVLRTLNRANKA